MVLTMPAFTMTHSVTSRTETKSFVPDWVKDAIFYQIFPERFSNGDHSINPPNVEPWGGTPKPKNYFGGDLQGIIDRLDYLASLGVNCIYLTPIFWSNSNHKYHAKDYLTIDPHFGNEEVFRRLVGECHARGIRIILDAVFNHTGVDFFAFEDVKKNGKASRYSRWFNVYSYPVGPPEKPNYECWWNWGDLPKLMTHNPEVREYLFRVTEHWMSFGIDGWRLDVPNEIAHPFWIEWRKLVKRLNSEAYIVGEIWDDASPWLQGDQFDAVMNYRFRRACIDFFAVRTTKPSQFDAALAAIRGSYPGDVNFALQNLLGSHDTERFLTLCNDKTESMILAWLFQMTYVGAPMVYYGDEVGMTGGKEPGSRGTMIWDEGKQDPELLQTMRQLTSMRNHYPVLRRGEFESFLVDDARSLYAFRRALRGESMSAVVLINNGLEPQSVGLNAFPWFRSSKWKQVFPTAGGGREYSDVLLPAQSGVVLITGPDSE